MKTRYPRRLFVAAAAIVGALAAAPSTGWIVRQELRAVGNQPLPSVAVVDSPRHDREAAVAAAYPDDFELQFASALETPWDVQPHQLSGIDSPSVRVLAALKNRFSRSELPATILRLLMVSNLRIGRASDEAVLLPATARVAQAKSPGTGVRTNPATLALAEDCARRGEALDPGNAYFPAMCALALFAEKRDGAAIDSLDDAAAKSTWNDYTSADTRARWALLRKTYGDTGAISRLEISATTLYPHYAELREMARLATALAVGKELGGDAAGGLRIRRAVARVGALMRAKSPNFIGSLVGGAITQIAASRPGGAPAISRDTDTGKAVGEANYVAYLTRLGHPDEARWFVAETNAENRVLAIVTSDIAIDEELQQARALARWWVSGGVLLLASLVMLTIGGAASLLARLPSVREGRPLRHTVHLRGAIGGAGIVAAFAGGAALVYEDLRVTTQDFCMQTLVAAAIVIGMGAFAVSLTVRLRGTTIRQALGEVLHGTGAAAAAAGGLSPLFGLCTLICPSAHGVSGMLDTLSGYEVDPGAIASAQRFIEAAMVFAVPSLTLLVLAIRSRIRRVPVSVGVVRGLRAVALPMVSALLLLYAGAVIATSIEENNLQAILESDLTNGGQRAADMVHQTWPGPVSVYVKGQK